MSPRLSWLWRELHRERGGTRHRAERTGRSSRAGVALLMVIALIAFMTIIVTEVVHGASVRIQLAANQRDEAKAEALAMGGVQFYRLLLIGSKQLEGNSLIESFGPMLGINADTLWQIIPTVSSNLLRILLVVDGDEDEARDIQRAGGLTEAQAQKSREESEIQTSLRKSFLDFDGDFTASVKDEDSRIFVGNLQATDLAQLQQSPHGILLQGLMMGEKQVDHLREYNLEQWELIANLADWTDPDDNRLYLGGRESQLYENLGDPYLPKNAAFDSTEEIRLVDGWEKDHVWNQYGKHLTIYGGGKINVNTCTRRVLEAVLHAGIDGVMSDDSIDLVIEMIDAFRNTPPALGGGFFRKPDDFINFIQQYATGTVRPELKDAITTKSTVFRVTSRGDVGRASVEIEAVFDFSRSRQGKVVYWRVQ